MGVLAKEIEATYEVLSKMGEGGMGAVYKVRHRFFDEIRVVKVMQAQLEPLSELKERFLGEAKRGKQLRHPNMAEVIDFSIAADGTSYIVMEYIEGVNLSDVLARNGGPLDYRIVIPLAEQALDALGFLHSRKFVHRDISPDNLMLTRDADGQTRVKLIDLGIAKSLEAKTQLTMAGKFLGKVQYASPEQFSGEVEPRSDLYSLGVVLYELLTGAKPIAGKDYLSIIAGHVSRPPRSFAETDPDGLVPPQIRAAVMKAMEKDPADRFQNAAAFAAALRAAVPESELRTLPGDITTKPSDAAPFAATVPIATEPMTAPPPAPATAPAADRTVPATEIPPPPARRWYLVSVIAAVLAVAAATALWLKQQNDAPQTVNDGGTVSNTIAGTVTNTLPAGATVTVAAPIEHGQLLINALPWGEVISVTNADGVAQALPPNAETPLLLSLPVGTYKVRVENPNSKRAEDLDATVTANGLARCVAELDRVDAGAYVEGLGIEQ